MTTLKNLKLVLAIESSDTSQDNLLNYYIQKASSLILNMCELDVLPVQLSDCVEEVALIKYRKRDSEYLDSVSEGGLKESYLDDLPEHVLKQIKRFKRAPQAEVPK